MKLIHNTGADRVIDLIRPHLKQGNQLGCVTPSFSLYAFAAMREALAALDRVQLILPLDDAALEFLGAEGDRAARNRLQARWLANQCAKWISEKVDRKSTRLNSSHVRISYAVFCLKNKTVSLSMVA